MEQLLQDKSSDAGRLIAAVDESRVGSRRLLPRKKQLPHPIFFVPVASEV